VGPLRRHLYHVQRPQFILSVVERNRKPSGWHNYQVASFHGCRKSQLGYGRVVKPCACLFPLTVRPFLRALGVVNEVQNHQFYMGYVGLSDTITAGMNYASMINKVWRKRFKKDPAEGETHQLSLTQRQGHLLSPL